MKHLALIVLLFLFQRSLSADEDPQELSDVRQAYGKNVESVVHPIREKYLAKLEALKRLLGAKGDLRGAVAVEKEIENIKASASDVIGPEKFSGTWKIHYNNGVVRRYAINENGGVIFDEEDGRSFPPRKGKIMLRQSKYYIEFQSGEVEMLDLKGDVLSTGLFNGKDTLASGIPQFKGIGAKERRGK